MELTGEKTEKLLEELLLEVKQLRFAVEQQPSKSLTDEPMTRDEAASFLKMHPDTLYKLARMNKVAYSRKGEGLRASMVFLKKDLDDYLERTRIPAVD